MINWGIHSMYGVGAYPVDFALAIPLIILVLILKGLVLWLTARRGQKWWFIFFLFVNTLGIGELIYLFATNGFNEFKKSNL